MTQIPLIERILASMTLAEKAAALCVARIVANPDGRLWEGNDPASPFGFVPATELIVGRGISSVLLMNAPSAEAIATWHNALQDLASQTRLGVPVQVASDPRHGSRFNVQTALVSSGLSRFPEPIGFAATRDTALTERAARAMARELRACGISVAVHPMADLATEARWARISGTFGEDPELAGKISAAWVRGLQGEVLGAQSVAATVKHFPGGGPQRDGLDSHFAEGAHTVYPGGRFNEHVRPFVDALDAGATRVMPGYAAPLGTPHESVGFAFARSIITDLLRGELGFEGLVVTDFNVVTGMRLPALGIELPVRAWGVEDLTPVQRVGRLFAAGVDQLGGEDDPTLIVDAVSAGEVTEERLDVSVRRVLADRLALGLLTEQPAAAATGTPVRLAPVSLAPVRVDPTRAAFPATTAEHRAVALATRRASVVALTGSAPGLPGMRVYAEGIPADTLAAYAEVVTDPAEADLAIVRVDAPFEEREGMLAGAFHDGALEFPPAQLEHLLTLCRAVPTVIDVYLERPTALPEVAEAAAALLGTFGVEDEIVLDAIFGYQPVNGALPFDLPRSTTAVAASRTDVPFDTVDPVFLFGHGLVWPGGNSRPALNHSHENPRPTSE
ncbi:glycoside hydrolase family 3 protein [Mycetocola tolaasinivorans]|uniref:beta-glucosidase n=1 Tax=Mycetocola tolaasinivorans TaxID=76635 RepID=A0A3L7A3F0_9MICO|nr:glycoside hydrolase family 3 N-terminal domain-containing protein [Mycetocola tolaasinivorans]RLP74789.1 glycoside hydrolase family 3 protein [Mycetocola tolaasinivorans]